MHSYSTRRGLLALPLLCLASSAQAIPHGFDFHATTMPASAGVAGTHVANPLDATAGLFGNPAALSNYKGLNVEYGMGYLKAYHVISTNTAHGAGLSNAVVEREKSGTKGGTTINFSVTQSLKEIGLPLTYSIGFSPLAGGQSDFRGNPNTVGIGANLAVLGGNFGLAYAPSDLYSLGISLTMASATGEISTGTSGSSASDNGLRATLGGKLNLGSTTLAAMYQSKLKFMMERSFQQTAAVWGALPFDLPENLGFGVSNNSLMEGNLTLMADYLFKHWSKANTAKDLWHNQHVASFGLEYKMNCHKFRFGWAYAVDPTRSDINGVGGYGAGDTVYLAGNAAQAAAGINQGLTHFLAATGAASIYRHRVGLGYGMKDVMPNLDFDVYYGHAFKRSKGWWAPRPANTFLYTIAHSEATVGGWMVGAGLKWRVGA